MPNRKRIVTHSGKYHTDDLFAVSTLQLLLGIENIEVLRTRDEDAIARADYVVDVGGVHDVEKRRFDHHQSGGAGTHTSGVPYASFGLVWKAYGAELAGGTEEAERVDRRLVQPIDAADNGHSLYELTSEKIPPYTIQSMLSSFWKNADEETTYDDIFLELLPLTRKILSREIEVAKGCVEAEKDICHAYEQADDKQIIIFEKDKEYGRELIGSVLCTYLEPIYAVLFRPDSDVWQTIAITKEPHTFENRKSFPASWGGNKTPEELETLTGFSDVVFVHRAGFMAVSKSKETAVALAKKSLEA